MEWLKNNFVDLLKLLILAPIGWLVIKYWSDIVLFAKRQKLKILPAKFNVGLSFDYTTGLNNHDYFNQIKQNLINTVDDLNLSNQIKIFDFSETVRFSNKIEAGKFCNKKKIDLIIWGSFTNDKLKKLGKPISSIRINFTFGLPSDKKTKIGKWLLMDVGSKLAIKNYWKIIDESSYDDIVKISNNIFDLSTYIIARVLQLSGKLSKALNLLESIYVRNNEDDQFRKQIVPHIIDCYRPIITDIGILNKQLEVGKQLCLGLLRYSQKDFFGLSNLAVFQYKTGDMQQAEETVKKLQEFYPNQPITYLDVAFFRILQKNYKGAFKLYEKLIEYKGDFGFNPLEVSEFLFFEYEKMKEPAFLYASGIVSKYLIGDEKLAKGDLMGFLKKANDVQYKEMFRKSKKILNK